MSGREEDRIQQSVPTARLPLLLLFLLLLGAGLRLFMIGSKAIWLDEAFSIWLANQPLIDLWAWLIRIDQHPPLYYTLLHLWQMALGDLQGAVRTFSALCSILTLPIFYGLARRIADQPTALIATLLLTIAPFHIRYAQEARMYALLTLTVAVALYLLAPLLLDSPPPSARRAHRQWIAFGIAQGAVMLTHNTAAVFFPLALNLAVGGTLMWRRWQGAVGSLPGVNHQLFPRQWLHSQGVALLCWLPWSVPFVIQSIGVDREFWIPAPTWTLVSETLHTFHLAFQPTVPVPWLVADLVYWGLFLLGCWRLRGRGARLGLLLSLCVVPIVVALLISLRRPIFFDRILIWVTLPYYLLIGAGIMELRNWFGRVGARYTVPLRRANWAVGILLLLLVALTGQALHNYYANFVKEGWDRAATHVADQAAPEDLILFNATWVQLPFVYYLRHEPIYPALAANLHGVPVDLFDRGVLEPKMTPADLPRLEELIDGRPRVWLVYSHEWYTDPTGIIPQALGQRLRLVDQREFTGLQVMEFVATPQSIHRRLKMSAK